MTFVDLILGKDPENKVRARLEEERDTFNKALLHLNMTLLDGNIKEIPVGDEWNEVLDEVFLKEITPYIPHDITTIVYINAKAGAESPMHKHAQEELVHLLSGKVESKSDGVIYSKPGDFFIIPKGAVHGLKFHEDSILILQWRPKLTN